MWWLEYKRNAYWTGTADMWHFYQTARAASNGNINHFLRETLHSLEQMRKCHTEQQLQMSNKLVSEFVLFNKTESVCCDCLCVSYFNRRPFLPARNRTALEELNAVSQWIHFAIKQSGVWQECLQHIYELPSHLMGAPALIEPSTLVWKDAAPTIYSQSPTKHSVCLWGSTRKVWYFLEGAAILDFPNPHPLIFYCHCSAASHYI